MWKMSVQYGFQDSNPQPLEHESPPRTTRPGLQPKSSYFAPTVTSLRSPACRPPSIQGRESWSSGYGRRLIFWRSRVRIPAPYTGWTWHFFTLICCKRPLHQLRHNHCPQMSSFLWLASSHDPHQVNNPFCWVVTRHSSVVLSTPTIIRSRVRIPSTQSTGFSILLLKLKLESEMEENKRKWGRDSSIF